MILRLIDQKIRRAFSDSAFQYEALAGLQKEIGRELIQKVLDREDCRRILDVGMGTGWLTNKLGYYFPEAKVIGIDFAPGMIECARQKYDSFQVLQANAAALPFRADTFELVVSNLTYQWIEDLPGAFRESCRSLKSGGTFCITLFGQATLTELYASLENIRPAENSPAGAGSFPLKRLPSPQRVAQAVKQAGFGDPKVKSETIQVHFPDMLALMRWLKDIGANVFQQGIFLGRERLNKANDYYRAHFADRWGVTASFEVIWVEARKP